MNVKAIKTSQIIPGVENNLLSIIESSISSLEDNSIVAITSKVVSICQNRIAKKASTDKNKLIEKEADLFIPPEENKHGFYLSIKDDILIPSAGIDESNAGNYYVLWPQNPFQVAGEIRMFLKNKFSLQHVGVIITDSTTAPLRWGTRGICIAYSGFNPLKDYIGRPDIFGRKLEVTKANVADALAASAVLEMGEGSEQTPIAVINDIPFVQFQDRDPTPEEIKNLRITLDDDIYAPILKAVKWKKNN